MQEWKRLLNLGIITCILGAVIAVVSTQAPNTQISTMALALGMFALGLGVGWLIGATWVRRLTKEQSITPPPPPPPT